MPGKPARGLWHDRGDMDGVVRKKFKEPFTEGEVAADWRVRGFSCGLFVDPPGRAWNDFVHRTNELVTVAEGQLEMTIAGHKIVVEPGDEVFIPRESLHSVKNIHRGTTRWYFGYD